MSIPYQVGSRGTIRVDAVAVAQVKGWSYSGLARELIDKTVIGDTVESVAQSDVLSPGVVSVDVLLDATGEQKTIIDGVLNGMSEVLLQVELELSGSDNYISGSAYPSNVSVQATKGEMISATMDLQFTDTAPVFIQP